jgi:uncharacterized protein YxeA
MKKFLIIISIFIGLLLIIGLGMFIYNQAADTLDGAQLDGQKVDSYNREFLQYEGTKQGSQVKTLLNNIKAHNRKAEDASQVIIATEEEYESNAKVSAPSEESKEDVDDGISGIKILSAKTYNITFAYDPDSGYVTAVGITEKTSK